MWGKLKPGEKARIAGEPSANESRILARFSGACSTPAKDASCDIDHSKCQSSLVRSRCPPSDRPCCDGIPFVRLSLLEEAGIDSPRETCRSVVVFLKKRRLLPTTNYRSSFAYSLVGTRLIHARQNATQAFDARRRDVLLVSQFRPQPSGAGIDARPTMLGKRRTVQTWGGFLD
jgi:hypothetical protein